MFLLAIQHQSFIKIENTIIMILSLPNHYKTFLKNYKLIIMAVFVSDV